MTQSLSLHNDLRFGDDTDIDALGISSEELVWRLPANLPRKPEGLSLVEPQYDTTHRPYVLERQDYLPSRLIWCAPILALAVLTLSLGLIAVRIPTLWLLLPLLIGITVCLWTCIDLRRHRLSLDDHGIHFGILDQMPEYSVSWLALAGVTVESSWFGRRLIIMHRQGPDASLELSHLIHLDQAVKQIRDYQRGLYRTPHPSACVSKSART